MAKAAPATRERPTGPAVAIAAAPVDAAEVPVELDEPEVWLDPDVVAVPVERVEEPVPVVVDPEAVRVEVLETTEVLPVSDPEAEPEAEPEVVEVSATTGDESPAGMDAAAGWDVTTSG